jgi:hypothetical protein
MSAALVDADRNRLAKLLGLLGSDHAGERDAAGLAASRLVQERGATWYDVVAPSVQVREQSQHPETHQRHSDDRDLDPVGPDWRRTAAACARHQLLLNRWEDEFLSGLPRFPRLSSKQRDVLRKIVVRLRACGCRV